MLKITTLDSARYDSFFPQDDYSIQWRVGERFPELAASEVLSLEADGKELAVVKKMIRESFSLKSVSMTDEPVIGSEARFLYERIREYANYCMVEGK